MAKGILDCPPPPLTCLELVYIFDICMSFWNQTSQHDWLRLRPPDPGGAVGGSTDFWTFKKKSNGVPGISLCPAIKRQGGPAACKLHTIFRSKHRKQTICLQVDQHEYMTVRYATYVVKMLMPHTGWRGISGHTAPGTLTAFYV